MASFHTRNDEYAWHVWVNIAVLRNCVCVRANRVERWLYSSAGIWKNEVALLPARPFVRFALSFGKQNARATNEPEGRKGKSKRERLTIIPLHRHNHSTLLISIAFPCFVWIIYVYSTRIHVLLFQISISHIYIDKIWKLINSLSWNSYIIYSLLTDVLQIIDSWIYVTELVKQILKNFTYVHKETTYQSFYILKKNRLSV